MDEDILKRMKEVEQAVLDIDESVRASAFSMMQEYILGEPMERRSLIEVDRKVDPGDDEGEPPADVEAFFSTREFKKPADAVYAVAAYFFSQYGSSPFTIEDVRSLADQVGLTVPSRPDATLRQARRNKKSLFRGKDGTWAPTATGEVVLKEKFDITKGRKKRPTQTDGAS